MHFNKPLWYLRFVHDSLLQTTKTLVKFLLMYFLVFYSWEQLLVFKSTQLRSKWKVVWQILFLC